MFFCSTSGLHNVFVGGLGFSLLLASHLAPAASFTLAPGSPSLGLYGFSPSDIFVTPGAIGGPPTLAIPAVALGLTAADNIDAMAFGPHIPDLGLSFSVDPGALGVAGTAVAIEAAAGQAAGDIFSSAGGGGNVLLINQDLSGLIPVAPAGAPAGPPLDDVDSLEANAPAVLGAATPLIFSVDAASPLLLAFPGTGPGDLFVTFPGGGPPAPFIPFGALGLVPGDDVDALIFDATLGFAAPPLISLAPGSPSLGILGLSPGDLLIAVAGLPVFAPAPALGLIGIPGGGDNLNAATVIPLPAPMVLLAPTLMVLWRCRRAAQS